MNVKIIFLLPCHFAQALPNHLHAQVVLCQANENCNQVMDLWNPANRNRKQKQVVLNQAKKKQSLEVCLMNLENPSPATIFVQIDWGVVSVRCCCLVCPNKYPYYISNN